MNPNGNELKPKVDSANEFVVVCVCYKDSF